MCFLPLGFADVASAVAGSNLLLFLALEKKSDQSKNVRINLGVNIKLCWVSNYSLRIIYLALFIKHG